jgi:hypothetical protein
MVKDFEHNGKTYRYDSDALNITQLVVVEEIWEFKRQQLGKPPGRLEQLRQSGGDEYFQRACANLLVEVIADKPGKYTRHRADTEVFEFVQQLPATRYKELREVIEDFFQLAGRSEIVSDVLDRSSLNVMEMIAMLSSSPQLLNALDAIGNSSNASVLKDDSMTPENSNDESASPDTPNSLS